jgi:hypothetical protein
MDLEAAALQLLKALERASVTDPGVGEAIVELRASIAKAHYQRTIESLAPTKKRRRKK